MKPIPIAKPCPINWRALPPEGRGRYCNTCERNVVDLAQHSDAEVWRLMSRNGGEVCVIQTIVDGELVTASRSRGRGLVAGAMAAMAMAACSEPAPTQSHDAQSYGGLPPGVAGGIPEPTHQMRTFSSIEFVAGSVALSDKALRLIGEIAKSLKEQHADATFVSYRQGDTLGEKRAAAVVAAFAEVGVSAMSTVNGGLADGTVLVEASVPLR